MPHLIFRFHKGRNNNIYDWKASDKIMPADVREVMDKTNILTSAAGTSIPTPIGRMYLFKTAFEITAAQVRNDQVDNKSIYSGIVSETLDLLELLYKSGSDENKFRYYKWTFDNSQSDAKTISTYFGEKDGHKLLAESFKQAASQKPFNNKIEITFIYYREGKNEILLGGTSPFTFVFTTPNFKRKFREKGVKPFAGLVSNDILFDDDYKQLHERDESFIKYIESLVNSEGINESFSGITEYVVNTAKRYHTAFDGTLPVLKDIQFSDIPLSVSNIGLKQISEEEYKNKINLYSDFKMELPEDASYKDALTPLFLLDKMTYEGQYISPNSRWSDATRVSENEYPETTLEEIAGREIPGMKGLYYPFLSSFDFFERCLVKLPGYNLNNERFVTLTDNQSYIYPIKPLFFHFFPVSKLTTFVSIESGKNKDGKETFTVIIKIPVYGPTKGRRVFICRKTYEEDAIITYSGILGIFPLTKATQNSLLHINKYTIASFEKTNEPILLDSIKFLKKTGIHKADTSPVLRSDYDQINTKTTYYPLAESFEIIQLNFRKDNSTIGGIILPRFKDVTNGTEEYVYAIDFGTSNTHIEYGRVVNDKVTETYPFTIDEKSMQMALLNKPREIILHDGAEKYRDYEGSLGNIIETARQVTLREFVPFQIGNQKSASVKFPFRTANCESKNFIKSQSNNRLFIDANIGFNIDDDSLLEYVKYETDLKWRLERSGNDQFNINRVSIFFKELLLLIRTKILLEENNLKGDITKLQIAMSLPVSMGSTLKKQLIKLMDSQRIEVLGANSLPIKEVSESIAPYYQLKYINNNIQNDSFCNIDIGGGTSDIVLINRNPDNFNELFCYCSSFKFAGRQLWSSGSNEFNTSENGFIAYYKTFIEKADSTVYNKLKVLLNSKAQKTEDLVGLLFSKPEYRFTDIFSEQKELKAVLLIHYSAILYYITRLAQLKEVDLPRTISFSGKGSEYLSIIFPSNNLLKGFTQNILGIFAGKPTRNDFLIERSKEPKVITAKGSAHFANEKINQDNDDWGAGVPANPNEKKLVLKETNYKGFRDLSLEIPILTYATLSQNDKLYEDIMKNLQDFFNLMFDNKELCTLLNKHLEFNDFAKYKSFFVPKSGEITKEGKLRDSFKATLANMNQNDIITDSPFFFALNYSLIELSREIASTPINK